MISGYCVYVHYRPNGAPFYVGKATGLRRPYSFTRRTLKHKNVVAKYGAEKIVVSVLLMGTEQEALAKEVELIAQFTAEGHSLANLTPGGDCGSSGHRHTAEARRRIALAARGRTHTEEARRKIGDAHRGVKHSEESRRKNAEGHRGIKHSDDTKRKISEAQRGRKISAEHRLKLVVANTGKVPTDETRRKWSEQRTGRKATPETRALLSAIRTGKSIRQPPRPWQAPIISARFKGVAKSAQHRAKIAAAHRALGAAALEMRAAMGCWFDIAA